MELKNFLHFPEPNCLFKKSCISVVSLLVNTSVITKLISNRKQHELIESFVPETELFKEVKKQVFNALQNNLSLPKTIKMSLTYFIHPMVRQIFNFMESIYIFDESTAENLLWKFVWTDRGVLDKQKSVEAIIKLNNLKTEFCFMLACVFGLETILLQFYDNKPSYNHYSTCIERYVKCIADIKSNSCSGPVVELSPMEIFDVYSIVNDACVVKFIISMKNAQEQVRFVQCLLHIIFDFGYKINNEGIRYLLSWVSPQVAVDIVHKNALHYLLSLLDWTCLDLFIPSVKNLWSCLTNSEYLHLTEEIIKRFQEFDFSPDYQILFFQFWEESPELFQDYVYLKCISGSFLSRLLIIKHIDDIFEKIMQGASPDVRQKMIFHFEGMNICDTLVRKGNLGLLEKFVRCCIPNKTVLSGFLNQYVEYKPYYFNEEMNLRKQKFREIVTQWFQ